MKEFADFLGGQAPFDALDAEDLARLVARVEVEYFAAGATVVAEGERLTHLWVVRTGALEVVDGTGSWTCWGPVTCSVTCGCCRTCRRPYGSARTKRACACGSRIRGPSSPSPNGCGSPRCTPVPPGRGSSGTPAWPGRPAAGPPGAPDRLVRRDGPGP